MDRTSMMFAPAIFALTLSASVWAGEAPVRVDVAHLQPAVAAGDVGDTKEVTPPAKDCRKHAKD